MNSNVIRRQLVTDEPTLIGTSIRLEGLGMQHVSQRYVEWLNDQEVCRDNRHGAKLNTWESTVAYVEAVNGSDAVAAFAIVRLMDQCHVGNISLTIDWTNNAGEIAILIGERQAWGKGIGREAYGLILDLACNRLLLRRLYSGMTVRNQAMRKVVEAVGMTCEGISKDAFYKDGVYVDVARYSLLNDKALLSED